nr:retrovirus-related Pol polyprotein from transposon TNT 1-94 [Tanacetum cinerariifolium]GFA15151.1 retrovirus-related Pol polyprotein from transposon TNT 1-94 [Tanacetum cinerariifolium]
MAAVYDVPQLVDKKGGSYAAIAPKLELRKFNKWKKRMLCYLAGMEPYYLKCIKEGPFQPKTTEGDAKPESQWTFDERRVVVQDQRLKSIIMSCLPDDIMESIISCVSAKETWTDLVHSFEGPSDTKENRIMDLKLKYQTFRAKYNKSLSQTYACYKTLLNELSNDDVNLSKHEINVGFMNSIPEKWLTFSHGLRNANHTQTLELKDIYGRFFYEDNLIQSRYSDTKKALITTPLSSAISTTFFSNNVIQEFQENSNDEVDERSSKKYLRDLDDEEEVSDEEQVTQVKVLMALADDELTVGKNHARNGEWVDITMRKVNTLLSMNEDAAWQDYLKILVPESQAVNESLETLNTPELSKDSEAEFHTQLPLLKNLQEASPSS